MRLIDADAYERDLMFSEEVYEAVDEDALRVVLNKLSDAPTVDAVERKRGEWIHDGYDIPHGVDWMHCSVCGRREPYVPAAMTNFCPSCGAEMRGEANE